MSGLVGSLILIIGILIIGFLFFRLVAQKVPITKKSVESQGLGDSGDYEGNKNLRNAALGYLTVGAALLGGGLIWSATDPSNFAPLLPMMIGLFPFLTGLILIAAFFIRVLINRSRRKKLS